jgi:hypothetical protein
MIAYASAAVDAKGGAVRRITFSLFLTLAGLTLLFAGSAGASRHATIKLKAQLNAGQEIPKQKVAAPRGTGRWTATLTGTSLKWKLTFAHLSGPATQAHVHMGARGKSGNVLIPLCAPCRTGATGTATVTAAEKQALLTGKTYVNVHTAKNPLGEIRGQVTRAR